MRLEVNNNKCKLNVGPKEMIKLDKAFSIRVPGAFFSPAFRHGDWDGKKHFITEAGYFKTGLLPEVVKFYKKEFPDKPITFDTDNSNLVKVKDVSKLKNFKLRPNQEAAVKAITENYVDGL